MTPKRDSKPKLRDAAEHKRFVETAKNLEASDAPEDFDRAFKKVVKNEKEKR